jgi:MoxR-like ATPase
VTGVSIFNQKLGDFEFRAGPILAQVLLADEVNRGTPKTQASLLEAMEERQVTVDGITYPLPTPFIVLATQNPIEYEGTFPLPESQLDRFLIRIRIGYPGRDDELAVLEQQRLTHPLQQIGAVADAADVTQLNYAARRILVDDRVRRYLVDLVRSTREHPDLLLGASPRAALALFRASQARALLLGRDFVLPDDVKALAQSVLSHRLIPTPAARVRDIDASAVLAELIASLPVPGSRVPA